MFTMTREEYAKRFEGIDYSDQITKGMTPEEVEEVYRSEAAVALTKEEYKQYILNEKLLDSITAFMNTDYNDIEDFEHNFKDWSYEDLLQANDYYKRELDRTEEARERSKAKQQEATTKHDQLQYAIMTETFTELALTYAVAGLACSKERINRVA